jgi:hypothetical protein
MDIERLYRHWSAGKPRDELVVNFEEVSGGALPCVYVPGATTDYDFALTIIPAGHSSLYMRSMALEFWKPTCALFSV